MWASSPPRERALDPQAGLGPCPKRGLGGVPSRKPGEGPRVLLFSSGQSKDEVAGTLEAVQQLQGAAQHLPKAREAFQSRCQELERLRREGASQKEMDKVSVVVGGPALQPSWDPWGGGC